MLGKIKKLLNAFWPFFLFFFIFLVIFYKVIFWHLMPLPSDLLVAWYFPYNMGGWEGYYPGITHKEFIAADIVRQLYPWKHLAVDIINSGQIPLWNPYAFSGTPLLANLQSAVFYPFNIVFFLFDFKSAWTILILSQPILAFSFMYLFVRSINLSKYSAFFGGLCFAFMGYMNIWFEWGVVGHSGLWLPLCLYAINKFAATGKIHNLVLGSIGLCLSIFAGHAQTAAYVYLITFIYYAWLFHRSTKEIIKNSWFFFLSLALCSVQLLPSLELLFYSARDVADSARVFHYFQLPPQNLLTIFAPDFFGNPAVGNFWGKDYGEFMGYFGIVALIFLVLGLKSYSKEKHVKFFFLVGFISILFALPLPFSESLLFFHVPIFGTGVPARTLFLFEFASVVIACFGMERFVMHKSLSFKPLLLLGSIYILLWIYCLSAAILNLPLGEYMKIASRNLVLPTILFGGTLVCLIFGSRRKILKTVIFLILIIFCTYEYSYFLYKFSPFAQSQFLYPKVSLLEKLKDTPPQRVYGYAPANLGTNLSTEWRVMTTEGYDSLYIKKYGELVSSTRKDDNTVMRSDAVFDETRPLSDTYAKSRLLNLLGVSFMLDKDSSIEKNNRDFPEKKFIYLWEDNGVRLYRNNQALPRAGVFYATESQINSEKILARLFDEKFNYTKTLLVESDLKLNGKGEATPAEIISYEPNAVEIEANANKRGVLFLSDSSYPGWNAYVDGKKQPIIRTNYVFRGVEISKGIHNVVFRYEPQAFFIGAIISGMSWLGVTIFGLISIYKIRRNKHEA